MDRGYLLMKKKILLTFIVVIFVCLMMPMAVHAASLHTVSDGETFDITFDASPGDFINVEAGVTATITGSNDAIEIRCGEGVNLTIDTLIIEQDSSIAPNCPIIFSGVGNTLNILGSCTLESYLNPGIWVNSSTELTIQGTGTLDVLGHRGAAIGGREYDTLGSITINSGIINAETNYDGAAAIGSGQDGNGGSITITGGIIYAASTGNYGAAIGSGNQASSAPDITITGGNVYVTNKSTYGAAIGGGFKCGSGDITITGGVIHAFDENGEGSGAGIGSGKDGNCGNINISGGTVYAGGGDGQDIGNGVGGTGGTLNITGDADILLENNTMCSVSCDSTIFVNSLYSEASRVPSRFTVPDTWSYPIGGYVKNVAPRFTADTVNAMQIIAAGNTPSALIADDPNGAGDIASFTLTSGSLPTGISLNNDGTFSGTSYAACSYISTIEVRDVGGLSATTTLNITVANEAPRFTTDTVNTSQIVATGSSIAHLIVDDPNGASDIARCLLVGGSLPTGVTLNNDGTFSGTVYSAGIYTAYIEVMDNLGLTAITTLNIIVNDTLVTITPATATLGYSETCTLSAVTNPNGQTVTWSSSDVTIAAVNPTTGEVTAGTKEGRAVIKAQTAGGFGECEVYVVDNSAPAPKPSDPVKTLLIQIKDDTGMPLAGVYVNLFSEPQTVRTDINGMAVFTNVPYNTNDPHTLIVQDALGSEIQRYTLNFISGTSPSATIDGNNINVTFNSTVKSTSIAFTMVEDWIAGIVANVEYVPVVYQKVENPQTGYFD